MFIINNDQLFALFIVIFVAMMWAMFYIIWKEIYLSRLRIHKLESDVSALNLFTGIPTGDRE